MGKNTRLHKVVKKNRKNGSGPFAENGRIVKVCVSVCFGACFDTVYIRHCINVCSPCIGCSFIDLSLTVNGLPC